MGIARGGLLSQDGARKQMEAAIDGGAPALFSGLGSPAFAIEAAHARGALVGGLVGKVRQARREIEAGVDLIIAQGYDAGGHTGEIGTFTLVPRVVQAARETGTPVLAGGGIGTGAHLAASLAMGAAGVWCGSIWLPSRESDMSLVVKEKLIAGTEEDTVRTRALTGKPARLLKTKYTEVWEAPDAPKPLPMPLQPMLNAELQRALSLANMDEWAGTPAGQMIGSINAMKPCSEIVFDLVSEAREALERLGVGDPTPV